MSSKIYWVERCKGLESINSELLVLIEKAIIRGHIPVGSTWFVDAEQAIAKAEGGLK